MVNSQLAPIKMGWIRRRFAAANRLISDLILMALTCQAVQRSRRRLLTLLQHQVRQADNYQNFPDFSRFFLVFPWTSGRALDSWRPDAENGRTNGGKLVTNGQKNGITALQKTVDACFSGPRAADLS